MSLGSLPTGLFGALKAEAGLPWISWISLGQRPFKFAFEPDVLGRIAEFGLFRTNCQITDSV